jgi:predicted HTH transcriptional regulator
LIFIGKNDTGKVVGVDAFKRLMDDIPNKIRNAIGITVEVNLHQKSAKYFIEIITYPYSVPISLRGRYYHRCGSTKQELTGASLNEFLLQKSGKTRTDVLGLNDRQLKAIFFVKEQGKISNADFQELYLVSKATATRDLTELVGKYEIFEKHGQTGAGTTYILKK